jgi:hypothetical protein
MSDDPFDPANFEMDQEPLPASIRRGLIPKLWYDAKHIGPTGGMYWPWIKLEVDDWFWVPLDKESNQVNRIRSNWTAVKKVVTWVPGLSKWYWTIKEAPHPHRPELGLGILCTRVSRGGRGKYKRNKHGHYGRKKMVRSWYDSKLQGPVTGEDYPWLGLGVGDSFFVPKSSLPATKLSVKKRVQANLAHAKRRAPLLKEWGFQFRTEYLDQIGVCIRVKRIR